MISRIVRGFADRVKPPLAALQAQAAKRPLVSLAALVAYSGVLVVGGLAIGNWAADNDIKTKAAQAFADLPIVRQISEARRAGGLQTQTVGWSLLPDTSNLHHLEIATLQLAPFDSYGDGGAIAEIDGNIVFASPIGQLGYLSRGHELRALDLRVPMNIDALIASPIAEDIDFAMSHFRTLDLLPIQTGEGAYDLYVSHHRFNAEGSCFEFVVSRIPMTADDAGLTPAGDFAQVFVASPCMQTKQVDVAWGGMESGGRLVQLNPTTILVSIGDHQFDGVRYPIPMAQQPDTHLGKIVAIDIPTGAARIFASGVRNPQGLLVARDGVIWETEHGPQGGDELNIIREGANYGWPFVTYGMEYGWRPRVNWALNPTPGRHDGYVHPALSFVPSIGISNLIQPDPREFPLWRDHLMVASLGGYEANATGTLFLVRIEDGDDPVYAEPIRIEGEELRDIISLADGRIAILTDNRNLLLLRNEDQTEAPHEAEFEVATAEGVADAAVLAIAHAEDARATTYGRNAFSSHCAACHALDGTTRIGPPLNGVVGRRVGGVEGFTYSPGLAGHDETWSERRVARFVTDPAGEFAGTAMAPVGITEDDAAAIAAYLAEG